MANETVEEVVFRQPIAVIRRPVSANYESMIAAKIEEIEKLKRCLRSAARWILTHDIYKNMGQEILDEAKELLDDNGEFLQSKDN